MWTAMDKEGTAEWDDAAVKELVARYENLLDEKERLEKLIDDFLNLR